jgi:hypothetical protein
MFLILSRQSAHSCQALTPAAASLPRNISLLLVPFLLSLSKPQGLALLERLGKIQSRTSRLVWMQDWLMGIFALITVPTDYRHLEQFLQQLAPAMHWQLLEFVLVTVDLLCCELISVSFQLHCLLICAVLRLSCQLLLQSSF